MFPLDNNFLIHFSLFSTLPFFLAFLFYLYVFFVPYKHLFQYSKNHTVSMLANLLFSCNPSVLSIYFYIKQTNTTHHFSTLLLSYLTNSPFSFSYVTRFLYTLGTLFRLSHGLTTKDSHATAFPQSSALSPTIPLVSLPCCAIP